MEIPMISMFAFADETKPVDENLTKQELLEVIECLERQRDPIYDYSKSYVPRDYSHRIRGLTRSV
jgi:hypothetical protein